MCGSSLGWFKSGWFGWFLSELLDIFGASWCEWKGAIWSLRYLQPKEQFPKFLSALLSAVFGTKNLRIHPHLIIQVISHVTRRCFPEGSHSIISCHNRKRWTELNPRGFEVSHIDVVRWIWDWSRFFGKQQQKNIKKLGGALRKVHPYLGKIPQFDSYFANGFVQPPTRKPMWNMHLFAGIFARNIFRAFVLPTSQTKRSNGCWLVFWGWRPRYLSQFGTWHAVLPANMFIHDFCCLQFLQDVFPSKDRN